MRTQMSVAGAVALALTLGSTSIAHASQERDPPFTISRIDPTNGAEGVALDRNVTISLTASADPQTIDRGSIQTEIEGLGPIATEFKLSPNGKSVTLSFPAFLPEEATVVVSIVGDKILDTIGRRLDADRNGEKGGTGTLLFRTGVGRPMLTSCAMILGSVFDTAGNPLEGATIEAVLFGGDPLPPVGGSPAGRSRPAMGSPGPARTGTSLERCSGALVYSRADGSFAFTTVAFTGSESFLVHVRKPGFVEALRQVDVLSGGSVRIRDAHLQPMTPPVMVSAQKGGQVMSVDGQAMLDIPGDVLPSNAMVSVTMLTSAAFLRDRLPPQVSEAGTFVDIAVNDALTGESIETVSDLVTLTVPNRYNLPPGTRVPFGKIDHHTLVWSDLRDTYQGEGSAPDGLLGTVANDGSAIVVQFDHFCSICSSYCLPIAAPTSDQTSGDPGLGVTPAGNGNSCGQSVVNLREGFLWETFELPSFTEFGQEFGLTLGYSSAAAGPSVTLSSRVNYSSLRPVERTLFEFQVAGRHIGGYYERSTGERPYGTFFWDGRDAQGALLPTGSYPYTITPTSLNANSQVAIPASFGGPPTTVFNGVFYPGLVPLRANDITGRAVIVNLRESPYGAGWSLQEEPRIYLDADAAILLVEGNAEWRRFLPDPQAPHRWGAPVGDFTELTQDPATGEFARTLSNGTVQRFRPDGRIGSITDRFGNTTSFTHSGGLLSTITSPTGYRYDFFYSGNGKLTQIIDSAGRSTTFQVDSSGDLVEVTNAVGSRRTYRYDSEHLLVAQEGPRGEGSEYTQVSGRTVEARAYDTDGTTLLRRRTFSPSALEGEISTALAVGMGTQGVPIPIVIDRIDEVTDGRGVTSYHITDDQGRTIQTIDGLNRSVLYTYLSNGLTESRVRPDGSHTRYEYTPRGDLSKLSEHAPNGVLYSTRTYEYAAPFNALNRVVDEEGKETIYERDSLGRLTAIRDHLGNKTQLFYQEPSFQQLFTRILLPTGGKVELTYHPNGNVRTLTDFPDPTLNPSGRTVTISNDDSGNRSLVTYDDLTSIQYAYDALNRLVQQSDVVSGVLRTISLDYEEEGAGGCACNTGNLTKVRFEPSGESLTYSYDGLNRLTRQADQLERPTLYGWDAEGNLVTYENRNGPSERIVYSYDSAGQLTQKSVPGQGVTTYQYDSRGQLVGGASSSSQIGFVYDFLGRQTKSTTSISVPLDGGQILRLDHSLDYTYDRVGNRLSMRDDDGMVHLTYEYTDLHQLERLVAENLPGQSWTFTYDVSGRQAGIGLPASTGVAATLGYDLAGELTGINYGSTPPINLSYGPYDPKGNLTASTSGVLSATYGYDEGGALTSSAYNSVFGDARTNTSYVYGAANRLQSDSEYTYTYDNEGRLTRKASVGSSVVEHYIYDAEGQMIEWRQEHGAQELLVLAKYMYDPVGRRICKDVNGVMSAYVYDEADMLQELDGNGRAVRTYYYYSRGEQPLALYEDAESRLLGFATDRLGSVIAAIDATGAVSSSELYDEYGNLVLGGVGKGPFGFIGREADLESGLVYLRARYYDPTQGRFLSEDPIGLPGGINLYAYAGGNPTNYVDRYGAFPVLPFVGGIILGVLGIPNPFFDITSKLELAFFGKDLYDALTGEFLGISTAPDADIPDLSLIDLGPAYLDLIEANQLRPRAEEGNGCRGPSSF